MPRRLLTPAEKENRRVNNNKKQANRRAAQSFLKKISNVAEPVDEEKYERKVIGKQKYVMKSTLKELKEKVRNDVLHRFLGKFIRRKNIYKKYNLVQKETAFKSYDCYIIPSTFPGVEPDSDGLVFPMLEEQFREALREMLISTYIVFEKFVKLHKMTRSFLVISFKCFNNNLKMNFTEKKNFGNFETNNFQEFFDFNMSKWKQIYDSFFSKDYIIMYGIVNGELNMLKYNPLAGGSYKELPPCIKNSKSVINIKNEDNQCFRWCLLASHYPQQKNADRVSLYKKVVDPFDWSNVKFPMDINKIRFFEKKNNIRVNVYCVDDDKETKIPLHITKAKSESTVNLFFHEGHYSLIKNFSRFCGGDHGSNHHFNCERCLAPYALKESYLNHLEVCSQLNENNSLVKMPSLTKDSQIPTTHFTDHKKQKKAPVVLYADFECSLQKCDNHERKGVVAKHRANSFRIRIESIVDLGISLDYEYSGDDCDLKFVELLVQTLESKIQSKLAYYRKCFEKPVLSHQEENEFQNATKCIFCKKGFPDNSIKVRDHCHFTGKYEGAAHQFCNMKAYQSLKGKVKVPIFFHNANYDMKCIIAAFQKIQGENFVEKMGGIPCNMEIYKTLDINSFQINCSYAHLSSSLDTLIKNLPDEKKTLLKTIANGDEEKFHLIKKKGFYPYEKICSVEDLHFPIEELKMEDFNSKLNLSKMTKEDFDHVKNVIKKFNITNFKEYHDLYLKIDVYGLRDVFEYHRELTFKTYGLDAAHYIGLPSLTWQAGLKFTGVKLQQIMDKDMFEMFETMKRGGVSVISHKYAKANNHYLPDYDKEKEDSFLVQFDCNNLYGWAMSEALPTGDFQWIDPENFSLESYEQLDEEGLILEVDLEYPRELHDRDNDYPLAPEKLKINDHIKLAPNLNNKTKYILHIRNLKCYIEKGMILKKIHRVVSFTQSRWLKTYIDNNSNLRQKATNDFEKDFYKLMNNAFYGKTMENIRGRQNVQFCLTKEQFQKHTMSPLFADINVINPESLALVKTHKKVVVLDKPLYIGACVLDLSKLAMYKFHMDTMKVRYPEALMMKTDTDSLLYYIKTKDFYQDINSTPLANVEFSNFPKWHPLFETAHKKVPGWFQDECVDGSNGNMSIISEYVGLRAKSYSNKLYSFDQNNIGGYEDKKKAKGISSKHVKKRLAFEDYKDCLFNKSVISLGKGSDHEKFKDKIYSFRSFKMTMYSVEVGKDALNYNDDKRIPMEENEFMTYAIGHWRTKV
jgi:hypothetical protein